MVAQILLVVEPVGAYLFCGAFGDGFVVFTDPESGGFGQGGAVFMEQGAGNDLIFSVGDDVGVEFRVYCVNGGLLGSGL